MATIKFDYTGDCFFCDSPTTRTPTRGAWRAVAMTTNPHEEVARARKVISILGVIPTGRSQAENDLVAQFLESLSPPQRQVYEILAGLRHTASQATWDLVISAVRARHVPGDGGAIDRQQDLRRPDYAAVAHDEFHPAHKQLFETCAACRRLICTLDQAFDAGVTAAVRAVGL
jgi:hypothetical protein